MSVGTVLRTLAHPTTASAHDVRVAQNNLKLPYSPLNQL